MRNFLMISHNFEKLSCSNALISQNEKGSHNNDKLSCSNVLFLIKRSVLLIMPWLLITYLVI